MGIYSSTFPPFVFVFGPWLLLGLILSGPFLLLLTVVVTAAIIPALLVMPFLVLRRVRARVREPRLALREVTA